MSQAFTPTYYKSRIYIDLSSNEIYTSNFEQLLRWIFNKPTHIKPTLGKPPEFLNDDVINLGTAAKGRRARDLIRTAFPAAEGALDDYLASLTDGLEYLRIESGNGRQIDDEVMAKIEAFLPYRNEFVK